MSGQLVSVLLKSGLIDEKKGFWDLLSVKAVES